MTRTKGTGGKKVQAVIKGSQRPSEVSAREAVSKAIETIEEKLRSTDLKATIGDFIRLLQLQKELREGDPKEIKVTWVEPAEMECVSGR